MFSKLLQYRVWYVLLLRLRLPTRGLLALISAIALPDLDGDAPGEASKGRERGTGRACSGLMYTGVPRMAPSRVRSEFRSARRARPKSVSRGRPRSSIRIFEGFRSRW